MAWPELKTLDRRVGVVIPTRNRAHYLPAALHSVLAQTHRPEHVVVVDDGSDDDTADVVNQFAGVEYVRVGRNLARSPGCAFPRNVGSKLLADLPYLWSMDDDDFAPPDYLERLLRAIETDCRAAVAYPRIQQFGARGELLSHPYSREQFARSNYVCNTSLVRTDALRQIGWWPEGRGFEDWSAWRRMVGHGWRMVQADAVYYWRRHADSETGRASADHQYEWAATIDQSFDFATIAIPFAGREWCLEPMLSALEAQTFPHRNASVLFLDSSNDEAFGRRLRDWLARCDFGDVRYVRHEQADVEGLNGAAIADLPLQAGCRQLGDVVNDRVAALWGRIGQLATTDLIWALEDDTIPPPYAFERLASRFSPQVDAVSGCYPGRGHAWCIWEHESLDPLRVRTLNRSAGLQTIGGCGMGCVLLRRSVLTAGPARSAGQGAGHKWYDWNLWADLARRGGSVQVDWDVVCDHLMKPPVTSKPKRKPVKRGQ